jgi:hypothetical protein
VFWNQVWSKGNLDCEHIKFQLPHHFYMAEKCGYWNKGM